MAQITIDAESGSAGVLTDAMSTWTEAREATTGTVSDTVGLSNTKAAGSFRCGRLFTNFVSTGIPAGSKITNVVLRHPKISSVDNDSGITVYVVDHTGSNPIVAADINNITLNSDTTYASSLLSAMSTTGTTDFTLDANGIAVVQSAVNSQSLIKLALRGSMDIDNETPGPGDNDSNGYQSTIDNADLIVTYTPPGALFLLNMV